jgi:hypothetical protein
VPFWLGHWIFTGHWLPGLVAVGGFAFFALGWVVRYQSYLDGPVGEIWDLSRSEPQFAELRSHDTAAAAPRPTPLHIPGPTAAPGFVRHTLDEPVSLFSLFGPDVRPRCLAFRPDAGQAERLGMATDLAATFRQGGAALGPVYTAWRHGQTLYVSLLPGADADQRTVEVSLAGGVDDVKMIAYWTPTEAGWCTVTPEEYRRVLSGWRPDRGGVNLGRERALRILDERGVAFRFPVSPTEGPPESQCGWRPDDRTGPPRYGWYRDPRLIDPSVIAWQPLHHAPTGAAVVDHLVRGSWSDEALRELEDAAEVLLPGRHAIPLFEHGSRRLTVYLGVFPGYVNNRSGADERRDTDDVHRTPSLVRAVFGHVMATERGILLDGPSPVNRLEVPAPWAAERFEEALRGAEGSEVIQPADYAHHDEYYQAEWVKLRQSRNLDALREELFSLDDVGDDNRLWRYVSDHEWRAPSD